MSSIVVRWWTEANKDQSIAVRLYSRHAVADHTKECPILCQPIIEAEVSEIDPSVQYRVDDIEYVMAKLPCCENVFHCLALAIHFVLHNMRCPLCRTGYDDCMVSSCLPISCRIPIKKYVTKIKTDIHRETAQADLDLIQAEEGIHSTELITELLLLRQWPLVVPNLQMEIMFHIPIEQKTKALEILNGLNPPITGIPRWCQCYGGVRTFCNLVERYTDDDISILKIQNNQCRRISKDFCKIQPQSISFDICYSDGDDTITQIAGSDPILVRPDQKAIGGNLFFFSDEHAQVTGSADMIQFEGSKNPGVESVQCTLFKDSIMERLVYRHLCLHYYSTQYNMQPSNIVYLG